MPRCCEHGALPLTVLDQVIDRWIQDQRSGKDAGPPPAQ